MADLTRREVLSTGLLGLSSLALAHPALAFLQDPYSPFKMGIQSYSLRGVGFPKAVEQCGELSLQYLEAFPGHFPMTEDPAVIKSTKELLAQNKVKLTAWGVQGFGDNEAECRKVFEFAKAMGIAVISADPSKESLPILDKLVREFRIAIAIHNHGPGARYDKLDSVLQAVEGRDTLLGACVDTGHALRSQEDPVRWIQKLGKRVHGVHLKDVRDAKTFTILGEGDLRVVEFLKELRKIGYSQPISLEYEENPDNVLPDIKACLANVRAAIEVVRKSK
ncbi:MAG: sugar phosphate isomerase/epimerase [Fimbriimonadaceae bacterium]|nr:sugar phosphate isomerase/epimerase [Fimbriimonadaceae bacterium]